MYIFCVQFFLSFNVTSIYSYDDLSHDWHYQAALYCGLLLILLKSCLPGLQHVLKFEMKTVSKQIIRICVQWRVLVKLFPPPI